MISIDRPLVIIGDRINPSGRGVLAAEMRAGRMDRVRADAAAQVRAGALMLDVNAAIAGEDEPALLVTAIRVVSETCDAPICIDSPSADAVAAGLAAYEGKALVNSVTAEEEHMARILPLVKKHRAAVVGMTIDENGFSMTPAARVALARRIVERAADHGIAPHDVIIDAVALPTAKFAEGVDVTLATMRLIRDELGCNITCGVSNVSFGLPDRATADSAFLRQAIRAGLTCAIANPLRLLSFHPEP